MRKTIAYFHLPSLFEAYAFYRVFLPLFFEHREYFYDWCAIGSLYGAPADCIWGGGRVGSGERSAQEVLALTRAYGLSARLTFSNSLLRPAHLSDGRCNALCRAFARSDGPQNGVIVHSDLLLDYLKANYPQLSFISSTTKVLTNFRQLRQELERADFSACNECCSFGCRERRACYEAVSRKNLGEPAEHICTAPGASAGYRFSSAMENPGFLSVGAIRNVYLPMGFSNFKLEGRGLGSAMLLEFLLYYLTKPAYRLRVREAIYLDAMLDLF